VRRRSGNQLVVNEKRVLAGALRLEAGGSSRLYGYELFSLLRTWEGQAPMDHGTLYRCLRKLEARGYFASQVELADPTTRRVRVYYSLTASGMAAAQVAARELADSPAGPAWIKPGLIWDS
jgi:DNA-binding PadR family transcriptional regulator